MPTLEAAEEDVADAVARALADTAAEFGRALDGATELVAARFSVGRIAGMWARRVPALVRRLLGVAETAAQQTASDVDAELPDGWTDLPGRHEDGRRLPDGLGQYVESTEALLRAVGDRLAQVAVRELAAGVDQGETVDQLRDRLAAAFAADEDGSQLGPGRAHRIAQTEATRAWNMATLAAARALTSRGRPLVKQWISRGDERVRPAHRQANGQLRFISEPFSVADVSLDVPGDPSAPPALTIGCRCRVAVAPSLNSAAGDVNSPRYAMRPGKIFVNPKTTAYGKYAGAKAAFHGTQGRPSYRKYHPKGGNRGISRHENGGMIGSDRFTAEEHSAVLESYTVNGYNDMNNWLRFRSDPEDSSSEEVQRQVSALNDLISIQEPTTSEETLFRGMRGHVLDFEVGDEFHDRGFVSTSTEERVGRMMVGKRGGTFFRINLPAGAQRVDVDSLGGWDREGEWILPPGTKYRVTKKGQLDDPTRPAVLYEVEVINA